MSVIRNKIAILGAGNIGSAIARGLVSAGLYQAGDVTLTRRKLEALSQFRQDGFRITADNVQAVRSSELILLTVTPQQLNGLLSEIAPTLDPGRHSVVSVVSGATIAEIRRRIGQEIAVLRAMPNTAISLRESMTCLSSDRGSDGSLPQVKTIFESLGKTLIIDEVLMVPATALCACGIAFFLRGVRAASQGGIEIGFHAEEALLMAAQTAKGAAALLLEAGNHPEREVDKVTTPQGCTIAGLNQMEHHGFSSSLIRGIVTSAEKAAILYAPREKKAIEDQAREDS
jgi:pyrroline-5-carboxylate reductase